jgi:hypothetical protein
MKNRIRKMKNRVFPTSVSCVSGQWNLPPVFHTVGRLQVDGQSPGGSKNILGIQEVRLGRCLGSSPRFI